MKSKSTIQPFSHARKFVSVGLMIFALAFLTVSNAFLYPDTGIETNISVNDQDPNECGKKTNNANNMAEERAETGSNSLSEYLHDHAEMGHPFDDDVLRHNKCNHIGDCLSLSFELNTPPPELS